MMLPHPDTARIVTESARAERLQHLALSQRYPRRPIALQVQAGALLVRLGRSLLAIGAALQIEEVADSKRARKQT